MGTAVAGYSKYHANDRIPSLLEKFCVDIDHVGPTVVIRVTHNKYSNHPSHSPRPCFYSLCESVLVVRSVAESAARSTQPSVAVAPRLGSMSKCKSRAYSTGKKNELPCADRAAQPFRSRAVQSCTSSITVWKHAPLPLVLLLMAQFA